MSDISNIWSNSGANFNSFDYGNNKASTVSKTANEKDSEKKTTVKNTVNSVTKDSKLGKIFGTPQLSEKAQAYYDELKKKYHNMDFVLVSKDQMAYAKSHASSFVGSKSITVLIDEDKIEKMASDESFRKQYESILDKASVDFSQFANSASATGANIAGYGMQINDDGTTSYFAVLKKSAALQKERIEKKAKENKAQKKEDAKKVEKKKAEEKKNEAKVKNDVEETTITANSWEDLLRKIEDFAQTDLSNNSLTKAEQSLGRNVDFSA